MSNPEDLIRDEVEYPAQTQQLQKHYMRSQDNQRSLLSIRTRLLELQTTQHTTSTATEKSQPIPTADLPDESFDNPVIGQFRQPLDIHPNRQRKNTMRTWYRAALIAVLCIAILGSLWYALLQLPHQAGQPVQPHKTPQQDSSILEILTMTMTSPTSGWGVVVTAQNETMTLAHTTDGGKTWQPFNSIQRQVSRMVTSALDDQTAWIILNTSSDPHAYGSAMRTTDAGKHWTDLRLPPEVQDVTFIDHQHGWGWNINPISQVESSRTIYATADGGTTWHSVSVMDPNRKPGDTVTGALPFDDVLDIQFVTAQHGWAILSALNGIPHAYLYQTQDGGKTWTLQQLPQPASGPISGIHVPMQEDKSAGASLFVRPPQFFSPQTGILSVTSQQNAQSPLKLYLYATNDGGQHWLPLGNTIENEGNLLMLDTSHILLANRTAITPYTLINNQWQKQPSPKITGPITFAIANGSHVWIHTQQTSGKQMVETLYMSSDKGNSWQQILHRTVPPLTLTYP
ncbi:hypothetical protein KDH_02450 [Dictyobacter sp. S3.2.2.5]|uniref:Photosynthesis system II assembly factor Ycf48/Hcf136-like domain-containing protein n=1 Tax=Dictyobacter halimunensis TaxID=3026934 RepID=A0ABQ6FH97_9CHLR|nr:hypothetical protein KDH_02450 [Dictyobacter sp. S3.2.2.5]